MSYFKHGLWKHRLFSRWQNMNQRCSNPNDKDYKNYGERGITVCNEWISDFSNYYNWAISNGYSEELTIDREDNDAGYNPSNCRFVTITENNRNRRSTKLNINLVLEIRNIKLLVGNITHQEIADTYGVDRKTIGDILNNKTWREL